jgi:hypothetical protein
VTGPDTTEHAGDATTAETPKPSGGKKRARRLVTWGAAGVIVVLLLVGSLVYTEQSSFCPTCHEMGPYYTAWKTGPHAKDASCVDCHVDAGVIAHLVHKPTALKEVWDHFFADNRFPNYTVDVPNSRCIRCHPSDRGPLLACEAPEQGDMQGLPHPGRPSRHAGGARRDRGAQVRRHDAHRQRHDGVEHPRSQEGHLPELPQPGEHEVLVVPPATAREPG